MGSANDPPIWTPYPNSPQEQALASTADITGYGGQAGGGKTDWLLGIASTQHRRSIIFRREFKQLRGLLQRSRDIFTGHGRFNGQDLIWRGLPGDREIEFGAVQHLGDERNFQGRPHDFIGFDELPHFLESQFWFLLGWLRTVMPNQRCRVGVTFNPPTNAKERWIIPFFGPWLDRKHPNPAMPGEIRWFARVNGEDVERPNGEPFDLNGETIVPLSRTFFPARLADNPVLAATNYGAQLQSLPEPLRSQLLYGDFDAGIEDSQWQVIPTKWIEAAMERWKTRKPTVPLGVIGMDVAHGGADKTVLAPRYGDYIGSLAKYPGRMTPDGKTAAAFAYEMYQPGAMVNVDAIGYGASAQEHLADMTYETPVSPTVPGQPSIVVPVLNASLRPMRVHKVHARAVNVAAKSHFRDRSGKYKMRNQRAEMYWRLREALDPEHGATMCLPPDPELLADLTAPTYEITPAGIQIEAKDDLKPQLSGRSPDCGDAVALSMLGDEKVELL